MCVCDTYIAHNKTACFGVIFNFEPVLLGKESTARNVNVAMTYIFGLSAAADSLDIGEVHCAMYLSLDSGLCYEYRTHLTGPLPNIVDFVPCLERKQSDGTESYVERHIVRSSYSHSTQIRQASGSRRIALPVFVCLTTDNGMTACARLLIDRLHRSKYSANPPQVNSP